MSESRNSTTTKILRTHRQVTGYGGTLKVTHIPTQPRRVLDAAGVGRIIQLD